MCVSKYVYTHTSVHFKPLKLLTHTERGLRTAVNHVTLKPLFTALLLQKCVLMTRERGPMDLDGNMLNTVYTLLNTCHCHVGNIIAALYISAVFLRKIMSHQEETNERMPVIIVVR